MTNEQHCKNIERFILESLEFANEKERPNAAILATIDTAMMGLAKATGQDADWCVHALEQILQAYGEMMKKGVCADCKHHNDYTGICGCPDSDFRADCTDGMFGCSKYEARECVKCEHYIGHECKVENCTVSSF